MSERNNTAVTTIEQGIQILAYNNHLWEGFGPHPKDYKTIQSLANAPYAYTEKQGLLAVALLKRYHTLFQKYNIDLTKLLTVPVFKEPFRVIDYEKSIERYEDKDKEWIEMKFPYNKKIIELIRTLKHEKSDQLVPMIYDGENKKWQIACTELTLYYCVLIAVRYDFKFVTPEMLDDFENVKKEKINHRRTKIILKGNKLHIKHAPESLTEWWNTNYAGKSFLHQCDVLKCLEIENNVEFITTDNSTLADRIAVNKSREIYVDRNRWTKIEFLNALLELDSLPALITTGSEFTSFKEINELYDWYEAFESVGIKPCEVAWGYTIEDAHNWKKLKNEDEFYSDPYPPEMSEAEREKVYDRWCDLQTISKASKYIDEHTKIIFVKSRIPRTMIKSKIIAKSSFTMFDASYWPSGTETLTRVLENLPKRIYYVTKSKAWLSNKKNEFL